jgi:hypothetical protein
MPEQQYIDRVRQIYVEMAAPEEGSPPKLQYPSRHKERAFAYKVITEVAGWVQYQTMLGGSLEDEHIETALAVAMFLIAKQVNEVPIT